MVSALLSKTTCLEESAAVSQGHSSSLWTGPPGEELRPPIKSRGGNITEMGPSAPGGPPDDHSPSWDHDSNLMRNRKSKSSSSASPKFLTQRNCEIVNAYCCFVFKIFIYLVALGLDCCAWAFSSCREWGLLFSCGVWASHCSGFSCCRSQALGLLGFSSFSLWALEHRLNSCGVQA